MNLLSLLNTVPNERMLWISKNRTCSLADIKSEVECIKNTHSKIQGKRVILEQQDQLNALIWMLALDRLATSIFLVPESLRSSNEYSLLKERFRPDFIINSSDNTVLDVIKQKPRAECHEVADASTWILATSGTTGTPKLIRHTNLSLTRTCKKNPDIGKKYIWGLVYDPFRFAGLQVVLQSLASGSTLVFANHFSEIAEQINFMQQNKVNALSATPTYWRKLLMSGIMKQKHLDLLQITLGGEVADQSVLNGLKQEFPNARVSHIYASTEAGVGFTVKDGLAGFPVEYLTTGLRNLSLKISDKGSLLIDPGKHTSSSEDNTNLYDESGYIDTGDLVEVKESRIYFLGRDSGAINVGGNKVIPEEIENVIRMLSEVKEVVVKPKKSGVIGQLVSAEVILQDNVDKKDFRPKLLAHCRQHLENYKVPALVRFVDQISLNSTGKINRN